MMINAKTHTHRKLQMRGEPNSHIYVITSTLTLARPRTPSVTHTRMHTPVCIHSLTRMWNAFTRLHSLASTQQHSLTRTRSIARTRSFARTRSIALTSTRSFARTQTRTRAQIDAAPLCIHSTENCVFEKRKEDLFKPGFVEENDESARSQDFTRRLLVA